MQIIPKKSSIINSKINFSSNAKQIKRYPKARRIAKKQCKEASDIEQLQEQITKYDALYFFENFDLICKILRPMLLTWNRRPENCLMNKNIEKLFKEMSQKVNSFKEYISVILPEYQIFCEFAKQITGKDISKITYFESGSQDFETEKHLVNFINFCEKRSFDETFSDKQPLPNNRMMSSIQIKLMQHILEKRLQQKQANQTLPNAAIPDVINNYVYQLSLGSIESDRNCLNCTRFFYENSYFNYDCSRSFFQVQILSLVESSKLNQIESKIKSSVCSFLNTEQGGLILIGCNQLGTGMKTVGLSLTQKQKQSVQQKVQTYMESMKPNIKRNRQIFIQFVPIFKHPGVSGTQEHIRGMYVIRIRVTPKEYIKFYYHELKALDSFLSEMRQNGQSIQLSSEHWYKVMMQKFKKYFESAQNNQKKTSKISKITFCHYNLECFKPERGKQFTDADREFMIKQIKQQEPKYKEKQVEIAPAPSKNTDEKKQSKEETEQSLKYITLLIIQKNADVEAFKKKCQEDEKLKGIQVKKIEYKESFKNLKRTWQVLHRCKFQKLQGIVKNQKKKMLLIQVLKYLSVELKQNPNQISNSHQKIYKNLWDDLERQLSYSVIGGKIVNRTVSTEQADQGSKKKSTSNYTQLIEFNSLEAALFGYFYLKQSPFLKDVKFKRLANIIKTQMGNKNQATQKFEETQDANQMQSTSQTYQTQNYDPQSSTTNYYNPNNQYYYNNYYQQGYYPNQYNQQYYNNVYPQGYQQQGYYQQPYYQQNNQYYQNYPQQNQYYYQQNGQYMQNGQYQYDQYGQYSQYELQTENEQNENNPKSEESPQK